MPRSATPRLPRRPPRRPAERDRFFSVSEPFTAQIFDNKARFLTSDNAKGGSPIALSAQEFSSKSNEPLELTPKGRRSRRRFSTLLSPWLNAGHRHDYRDLGMPVANAAELFKTINITDDWRHKIMSAAW